MYLRPLVSPEFCHTLLGSHTCASKKMAKILLLGFATLLFCGLAKAPWCRNGCRGDPCRSEYCYACGNQQCFTRRVSYDKFYFGAIIRGCTNDMFRYDECNTTQKMDGMTTVMTCCNEDGCNEKELPDMAQPVATLSSSSSDSEWVELELASTLEPTNTVETHLDHATEPDAEEALELEPRQGSPFKIRGL